MKMISSQSRKVAIPNTMTKMTAEMIEIMQKNIYCNGRLLPTRRVDLAHSCREGEGGQLFSGNHENCLTSKNRATFLWWSWKLLEIWLCFGFSQTTWQCVEAKLSSDQVHLLAWRPFPPSQHLRLGILPKVQICITRSNAEFVGAKRVNGPPPPAWQSVLKRRQNLNVFYSKKKHLKTQRQLCELKRTHKIVS